MKTKKTKEVSFSVCRSDAQLISEIADRAFTLCKKHNIRSITRLDIEMDVTAVHANGCPLRLVDLLEADGFNFTHDIFGINRHLDRETGKLDGRFFPRFHERTKSVAA